MATVRDYVKDAMVELGVIEATETPEADDAQYVVRKLIDLVDSWNAYRPAVFCEVFTPFNFVAGQQEYTVGPTGNIVLTLRPVTLDGVNVILNTVSPPVRQTVNIRDYQWWMNNTVQTITSSFPTDVYPKLDWPNARLYFWPKPTVAYGGEIVTRKLLDESLTLDTVITLPQGYPMALKYTLAEHIAQGFSTVISGDLERKGREARARIFSNNDFSGQFITQDAGMPSSSGNRPNLNWRTGLIQR